MELNLARNAKNNQKGFYTYVSLRRKLKESVSTLMSNSGKLVTTGEEEAEVFNNSLASVFTGNLSSQTSPMDGLQGGDWGEQSPSHCKRRSGL